MILDMETLSRILITILSLLVINLPGHSQLSAGLDSWDGSELLLQDTPISKGQQAIRSILGDDIGQMDFHSSAAKALRSHLVDSVLSDMNNNSYDGSYTESTTRIQFCADGSFVQLLSSYLSISSQEFDVSSGDEDVIPGYWDVASLPNGTLIILFYSTHPFILEDSTNGFIPFPVAQYSDDFIALPNGDGYYRTSNQYCY